MKVLMTPNTKSFKNEESGIRRVVEAYEKYGPEFGIEFVDSKVEDEDKYDLYVVHAGTTSRYPVEVPTAAMLHGLYWTSDYLATIWEWKANANVIASIQLARKVSVPSNWVAETLMRDMHLTPYVLPHGIEADDWLHSYENEGYILWNKNRAEDVCDPTAVTELAYRFPNLAFVTTFATKEHPANVFPIGPIHHGKMKELIQKAGVYLSSTKETFGIGTLEALASGTPVLGFAHGGNLDIVSHGVNGYLAQPLNYDDLAEGLDYVVKYRKILSENALTTVRSFSWEAAMEKVHLFFKDTIDDYRDEHSRPYRIGILENSAVE